MMITARRKLQVNEHLRRKNSWIAPVIIDLRQMSVPIALACVEKLVPAPETPCRDKPPLYHSRSSKGPAMIAWTHSINRSNKTVAMKHARMPGLTSTPSRWGQAIHVLGPRLVAMIRPSIRNTPNFGSFLSFDREKDLN